MEKLPRSFYRGDTVEIAQALLGTYLIRVLNGEWLVGRITETEAYVGRCDKACHAYNYRKTDRTAVMFGPPGHAYVYLIYGMYHCLNFVTEPEGEPSAVLLRGVTPVSGTETMRRLRFGEKPLTPYRKKNFLNGPGKVCRGFSIDKTLNGADLTGDALFLCRSLEGTGISVAAHPHERICAGPRIGVDYAEEARDFPWRFWLETEDA